MPSPLTSVALSLAIAAFAVAGCATTSDQAPPGLSLAGTWKLNPQLSTNTRKALQQLVPKAPRNRSGSPNGEDTADSSAGAGGGGPGPDTGPGPGTGQRYRSRTAPSEGDENFGIPIDISLQRSVLSGGDYLRIQQRPDEFVVWNGDTTNSYVPGEKSVVSVPSGVADQRSGWKGREYRIEIRPQVGPRVTESFRLSKDGRQLIETIVVGSEGRVRRLEVTRVYDPATDVPTIVPAGD